MQALLIVYKLIKGSLFFVWFCFESLSMITTRTEFRDLALFVLTDKQRNRQNQLLYCLRMCTG